MANKYIEIGNLIAKEKEDGTTSVFLALGKKNRDSNYSKYDLTVELVVKDATGKVVARQTDGFVSLNDPRKQADELLAKGIINEQDAAKMKERTAKLPPSIRYSMQVAKN
jgi:hypothetical protein